MFHAAVRRSASRNDRRSTEGCAGRRGSGAVGPSRARTLLRARANAGASVGGEASSLAESKPWYGAGSCEETPEGAIREQPHDEPGGKKRCAAEAVAREPGRGWPPAAHRFPGVKTQHELRVACDVSI